MLDFIKNRAAFPDELTVWQVAKILDCTERYVYQLLKERKIAHYRIGKKYAIDADDLVRFIQESRIKPTGTDV